MEVKKDPNELPLVGPMATEPALTIGEEFANKTMMRPYVAAAVAIVMQITNATIDDAMVDNITLLITLLAALYAAWEANRKKSELAKQQAEKTRAAVYAPATVAEIANEQYSAGLPPVEPQPEVPAPAEANIDLNG